MTEYIITFTSTEYLSIPAFRCEDYGVLYLSRFQCNVVATSAGDICHKSASHRGGRHLTEPTTTATRIRYDQCWNTTCSNSRQTAAPLIYGGSTTENIYRDNGKKTYQCTYGHGGTSRDTSRRTQGPVTYTRTVAVSGRKGRTYPAPVTYTKTVAVVRSKGRTYTAPATYTKTTVSAKRSKGRRQPAAATYTKTVAVVRSKGRTYTAPATYTKAVAVSKNKDRTAAESYSNTVPEMRTNDLICRPIANDLHSDGKDCKQSLPLNVSVFDGTHRGNCHQNN